ncbi:MAG: YkvA family protein [Chloroflexota bacterium]
MASKRDILKNENRGFFQDVVLRLKLILRLIGDRRVNFLLKLLPIGALIYLVSPIDLLPGAVIPVVGALDDAAVLWLGATLFVSLCPEDVVEEHTKALQKVVSSTWKDTPKQDESEEVIEVESREVSNDNE